MYHGDVERIAAIEQTSVSPWPAPLIVAELERPQGLQLVAAGDEDGSVVGWCCGIAAPEAELFKIAVVPSKRRTGVGTALLLQLEDLCRDKGCETLFLEVRAANTAAISLYEKLGFRGVGHRKNYYSNPQDDALILRKSLF
jgi:[ribosomal protein S18]-alanine N-acetyltransferase